MKKIEIYTDGGCEPNPGKGGWGWVVDDNTYNSGGEENTTNNRMELTAIIEAIKWAKDEGHALILIFSDSKYCVKGFMEWMYSWERRGWKRGEKELKNVDLWKDLWSMKAGVVLKWVKGHNGNALNEFADELCTHEIDSTHHATH